MQKIPLGRVMTYRTYSASQGSEEISPLKRSGVLYKEFDTLDDALAWARHVNESGRVALLIEGDDGTRLGKRALALHHAEARTR